MSQVKGARFTKGEEISNAISHGMGWAFSIVATVLMVVFAARNGGAIQIVSASVFGASMINLYMSSTMNHSLRLGSKAKEFFHNYDQIAIYLLIAGSYTPIALVALNGPWGWTMFGLEWGLAITGIIIKLFLPNKFEKGVNVFTVGSFILMGWMFVIFIVPIINQISSGGIWLISIGGLCYSLGVIFFSLEGKLRYTHLIWHIMVIGGTVCHWCAVRYFML
jgi:hemolysin III